MRVFVVEITISPTLHIQRVELNALQQVTISGLCDAVRAVRLINCKEQ